MNKSEGGGTLSFQLEADSDVRLDLLVAHSADISRTQAATLITQGHVLVDGRRERASYKGSAGESITVRIPAPQGRAVVPQEIPLHVVFEDETLLVVNKAAGMVVHPAPGNWDGTLVNALLGRGADLANVGGEDRPGLVHRLDKETSGLVVVAKTEKAHRNLSAALAARKIVRRYAALCWGHLDEDRVTVDKPLARNPRDRQRMAVVPGGKQAKTTFVRLARFPSCDLLRAHLHTGRTHQIRVHLSAIGHPVVGDDTYGGGGGRRLVGLPTKRHFLHAAWLSFTHPVTGAAMDFRAPLPEDLDRSVRLIAKEAGDDWSGDSLEHFGFFEEGAL